MFFVYEHYSTFMKTFRILGLIILAMIISFFVGAFFLPTQVHTTKSETIEAPIDSVFNLVNDFHRWQEWSPWYDTAKEYVITGADYGKGAIIRWVDKNGQVGERTILHSVFPDSIKILTQFREEGSEALMDFSFKSLSENSTEINISFKMENQFSYPFGRYVAWMLQSGVDLSFPRALANIKEIAELRLKE